MPLVWVTGISGSGKSTLVPELRALGLEAYDVDVGDFREWRVKETNEPTAPPEDPHDPLVMATLAFRLRRDRVEQLRLKAENAHVFLCGTVDNEVEVWDLFDRVICLVIDDDTLKRRIAARTNNTFGKAAHELEAILGWHSTVEANYRRFGATVIDASAPVRDVARAVAQAADALET